MKALYRSDESEFEKKVKAQLKKESDAAGG